jgi:glyoxylase-like metal-dependent hydrolase (beta-lactamase superfamily II)
MLASMLSALHARLAALLVCLLVSLQTYAQDFDTVEIRTTELANGIYMLEGAGGNIGVSVGPDGVFLIDDQYAPLSEKIRAALAELDEGPIRFLLNTHVHGDHIGGNENFGQGGTVILAHENVRRRMSVAQFATYLDREVPAAPPAALPVVTFEDGVTLHFNGQAVHITHLPSAHTDGDSIVHFPDSDVLHMGDVLFSATYPFVDLESGGTVEGTIAGVERGLEIAGENTKIIAGHGPLIGRTELEAYRSMLVTVRDLALWAIAGGQSVDQLIASDPLEELNPRWAGGDPALAERTIRAFYTDLSGP